MYNVFYKTGHIFYPPSIALKGIWEVYADKSYNCRNSDIDAEDYVAIRTISGQGSLKTIEDFFILESESLLIIKQKNIVQYHCSDDDWHFYWFVFLGNPPDQLLPDLIIPLKVELVESQLINELCKQINLAGPIQDLNISSMFYSLVTKWIQKSSCPQNLNLFPERLLKIVMDYENRNSSIATLAKLCYMSERNFRLIFAKHFKISPVQFISNQKLDTAYELLCTNNIMVKEVALICGFTNQYYFCRVFKKRFGFPPSNINKQI